MKMQQPSYDIEAPPFGGHSSTDAVAGASSDPERGPSKSDDAGSNPAARTLFLVGGDGQPHEIAVDTVLSMADSWRRAHFVCACGHASALHVSVADASGAIVDRYCGVSDCDESCGRQAWDAFDEILLDMQEVEDASDSKASEDAKSWTRHWRERLTEAVQALDATTEPETR